MSSDISDSSGRGVPPADQAEGTREQGEYAEARVEREQRERSGEVERGAAEEGSDAPLTETERETSRPPEERPTRQP